jgi:LacI family transcriptional regulator
LVKAGYRSITWVGPNLSTTQHYSTGERLAAVKTVVAAERMKLQQINVTASALHGLAGLDQRLTPENAFVAYDVQYAQSLAMAANEVGRIAGRDFGLVCCDDADQLRHWWSGLSRVGTDRFNVGKIAADMLLARLRAPEPTASRLVRGTWISGSTAPGPNGKSTSILKSGQN